MPNKDSAKKYMLITTKKKAVNDAWRTKMKNAERKLAKAVADKKKEDAAIAAASLQKLYDRAARRNVIHGNSAARKKSRAARAAKLA